MLEQRLKGLGFVQKHVLCVLANRGACTVTDWAAWYPYSADAVRGAMYGLEARGLVDMHGFDGKVRIYALTLEGREAAESIVN